MTHAWVVDFGSLDFTVPLFLFSFFFLLSHDSCVLACDRFTLVPPACEIIIGTYFQLLSVKRNVSLFFVRTHHQCLLDLLSWSYKVLKSILFKIFLCRVCKAKKKIQATSFFLSWKTLDLSIQRTARTLGLTVLLVVLTSTRIETLLTICFRVLILRECHHRSNIGFVLLSCFAARWWHRLSVSRHLLSLWQSVAVAPLNGHTLSRSVAPTRYNVREELAQT